METWELHNMGTLLDPRFKARGFSTASFAEMTKFLLLDQMREMSEKSATTIPEGCEGTQPCKKLRKESSLWEDFESDYSDFSLSTSDAEREIEQFLSLPRLPHSEDPLTFGLAHSSHFPYLSSLAKKNFAHSSSLGRL